MKKKSSQLFKQDLSLNYILEFLKSNLIYDSERDVYISDSYTFKKMRLFNKLVEFKTHMTPCYYDSKLNYPANILTLRGFNVVLRQICKYFSWKYTYKIRYIHSGYEIVYYISLPDSSSVTDCDEHSS